MGRRGPKPKPAEIKALKGSPNKQRDALIGAQAQHYGDTIGNLPGGELLTPEFLTKPREREIYRAVVEDLFQRGVIRTHDVWQLARWASLLDRWIHCKLRIDETGGTWTKENRKHYGEILKKSPYWSDLQEIERLLVPLEDRLGLNPLARQTIVKHIVANAMMQPTVIDSRPEPKEAAAPAADDDDPLGFLDGGPLH